MKIKYLLPVATIACTASVVAPLLTSCNKNKTPAADKDTKSWESGETYEPMEPAEAKSYGGKEGMGQLTQDYHDAVANNHAIILDDLLNFLSREYDERLIDIGVCYSKIEVEYLGVSDVMDVPNDTTNALPPTKYFNVDLDYKLSGEVKDYSPMPSSNDDLINFSFENLKIEMRNLPIYIDPVSPDPTAVESSVTNDNYSFYIHLCPPVFYDGELGKQWSVTMPKMTSDGQGGATIGVMTRYSLEKMPEEDSFEYNMFDLFTHPMSNVQSNYLKNAIWN